MNPSKDTRPTVHPFISYLEGLGRGDLAVLRRSAAHLGDFDAGAARVLYPRIPRGASGTEEPFFVVAALYALRPDRRDAPGAGNLGASARRFGLQGSSDGKPADALARRFERVLGSSKADLPRLLRDFVALIDTSGVPIDFTMLLKHYRGWGTADRWVQRTWARSFWVPRSDEAETRQEDTPGERAS